MEGQLAASGLVPFGAVDTKPGTDFRSAGGELISTKPEDYEKNVAVARQLMAEAGYPDGKGFPKVTFSFNTDVGHEKIVDAVKQMWEEKLGVQVEVVPEEWPEFYQSRQDGYYNIYRDGWIADSSDPALFLEVFASWDGNNTKYVNEKYDKLILASRYEKNPTKRMKLLHDAEKLLIDDAAIVPLYFYTTPALVSKKIKGIVKTRLGYVILRWTSYK